MPDTLFKMQERDLDLIILEEIHANSGFAEWMLAKLNLTGYRFIKAMHSVSAKVNAKWGESDIILYFEGRGESVVILVEDKIDAGFTDRQAERYRERATELVRDGGLSGYRTVLVAPQVYLNNLPADEQWDCKISIDEIKEWFAQRCSAHAAWRARILSDCLARPVRSGASADIEALRFAEAFATHLRTLNNGFWHVPTGDRWGLSVNFDGRTRGMRIDWKVNQSLVDLTLDGAQVGKLARVPPPGGMELYFANERLRSDMARIPVAAATWSDRLETQMPAVNEVVSACDRLRSLAFELARLP